MYIKFQWLCLLVLLLLLAGCATQTAQPIIQNNTPTPTVTAVPIANSTLMVS